MIRELTVDAAEAGLRLDLFVGKALALSRTRVKALFDEDRVRVGGRRAPKGHKTEAGQRIAVRLDEGVAALIPEPDSPLAILYQDDALVFVDKPAGRPSHPLQPGEGGTVANALASRFPEVEQASEEPREGGLCHRLDIETSGVLLAARSRAVWRAVRELFGKRQVDKRYWALVTGPIADDGEIELPLRHHPRRNDRVEPALSGGDDAREAFTAFRVLARVGEHSLVEARIETGVLHQVRAHLASIGAPIVGDGLYGGRATAGLDRFFLHARALGIRHPLSGSALRVEAPLPADLIGVLEHLGIPWS